ncbi:tRNA (adenosine(37)-N6)-threonylcarbamoyltransferase complex dimerization subunit type 1 TsaB [Maribacter sp. 2307ULW6-5]|uniref:tRNA (adenosine(37)-N6)-threonylcarbamoyltransferase complex dimerization subunit type 1 TsaB n=1 Tax=Maribacter sp. 2307ULW6-5 TaxID=3386275 RepID=UPI0039BD8EDD
MGLILNLETATTNCSVGVAQDGRLLSLKEHNAPNYSHGEQLHLFIKESLEMAGKDLGDLDAVAVSKGPGSYTGLRIGVSAAKGLCFALGLPLIAVPTLKSMALSVKERVRDMVVSVLDARRMEVYAAVYDARLQALGPTEAVVVNRDSFSIYRHREVLFVGSGAAKIADLLDHDTFSYDPTVIPSARQMVALSQERYAAGQLEDVAYFEPYYLKDFMLQTKKKQGH